MPLRPKYLAAKLRAPLVLLDGTTLKTLKDVSAHVLKLPDDRAKRQHWVRVFELFLDEAPAAEINQQVKLALLLEGKLDVKRTP